MKTKILFFAMLLYWPSLIHALERPTPTGLSINAGGSYQSILGRTASAGFYLQPGIQAGNFIYSLEVNFFAHNANTQYAYPGLNLGYSIFLPNLNTYIVPTLFAGMGIVTEQNTIPEFKNKESFALGVGTGFLLPVSQNHGLYLEPRFTMHSVADGTSIYDRDFFSIKFGLKYSAADLLPIAY